MNTDKETPVRPNYEGDGYDNQGNMIYDIWYCPRCGEGYEVDYDDYEYCPKCGQHIDWSIEDNKEITNEDKLKFVILDIENMLGELTKMITLSGRTFDDEISLIHNDIKEIWAIAHDVNMGRLDEVYTELKQMYEECL